MFPENRRILAHRVLLVDDVLTTGATASEVARVLKKAGASMVAVAVVARPGKRLVGRVDFNPVPQVYASAVSDSLREDLEQA